MKQRPALVLFFVICVAASFAAAAETGQSAGVVNINTADADQLQLLPQVGPALAARIIDYRKANGPFKTVQEIVAVKGIGDSSLEKLEPYLAMSGATTLTEKVRLPRAKKTGDATGS
ncbi:MAG: helix-hairpin-helix domain-containing protein [Thermoanaerobaculales bacterium]|nr:helix-hairpin-helix domain-containing protein [Thermoanaerobaculales bacterium]